jgi:5-methylcytosine-specific restriction protein B
LVPGPFRKVVDLARANPAEPYFLIVDEINRANLAKVFGELYFLLEYRDRTIDLLYSSGDSGPAFSLPANVYIIGTMNTADRSIALVDAAMRRRFAFLSLHPEDEKLDLVLRAWLRDRDLPEDVADLLVELNRRIQDKDFKIGPSYLMSPSVANDAGLDRIWRTSILPLLEEYHVGDGIDVRKKYGLDALRATLNLPDSGE